MLTSSEIKLLALDLGADQCGIAGALAFTMMANEQNKSFP